MPWSFVQQKILFQIWQLSVGGTVCVQVTLIKWITSSILKFFWVKSQCKVLGNIDDTNLSIKWKYVTLGHERKNKGKAQTFLISWRGWSLLFNHSQLEFFVNLNINFDLMCDFIIDIPCKFHRESFWRAYPFMWHSPTS